MTDTETETPTETLAGTKQPVNALTVVPAAEPVPSKVEPAPRDTFFDRTVANLRDLWWGIAGEGDEGAQARDRSVKKLRGRIEECLSGIGGEVSARARTAALGREYLALDTAERTAFLKLLAEEFGPEEEQLRTAARALADADGTSFGQATKRLRAALVSPRLTLLTQFNALPDGVKFLVGMRATVLDLARRDDIYRGLLDDLTELLRSWFDVGFLQLARITWDSSASLLEKLIAYEAVHEISSWDDLKDRLDSDRRCFAFFHPRMPDEPLIFVEVALTDGIADSIQALLDPEAPLFDPREADTAIFYSISNAQRGLAGISFGNFLIKRVVELLSAEFPGLKRFATLSPVPGFRKWLETRSAEELLLPAERKALPQRATGDQHPLALLKNPDWYKNEYLRSVLKGPLTRLMARYLVQEKRPDGRTALDPVAHFHLTNGARIEQIDWLGDVSPKGLRESAGIMVNYLYRRDDIEENHEAYTGDAKVAAASGIRSLARKKS